MTREDAIHRRNLLIRDLEFQKKVVAGDPEALKIIRDLAHEIVGEPDNWQRAPENFNMTKDNPWGDPSLG